MTLLFLVLKATRDELKDDDLPLIIEVDFLERSLVALPSIVDIRYHDVFIMTKFLVYSNQYVLSQSFWLQIQHPQVEASPSDCQDPWNRCWPQVYWTLDI